MADANLLQVLSKKGRKGSLDNIVVFGRVRCAIERPYIVGNSLEFASGFFAIIDCYALKCLGEDYFVDNGIWDIDKTYFIKGSMVIYLDNKSWIGQDVKVYGTSTRYGVKIRRQFNTKTSNDGITAFVFQRRDNKFIVVPNKLVKLGEKDSDVRGTGLEDFISAIVSTREIHYPKSVETVLPFEGVEEYTEISEEDISNAFDYVDDDEMVDVTKIDLHLTYHMDTAPMSRFNSAFQEEIDLKSKDRKDYAKSLLRLLTESYSAEYSEDFDPSEFGSSAGSDFMTSEDIYLSIRDKFIKEIAGRYTERIGYSEAKGKEFVDSIVSAMFNRAWSNEDDISGEQLIKAINYCESCIASDPTILYGNTGEVIDQIPLLKSARKFAIAVIGVTTGIGVDTLVSNMKYCERNYSMDSDLWFYALVRAPYALCMLGTSLSFVDADILYLSYYKHYGQGILKEENIELRGDILFLENLKNANDKNTMIPTSLLKSKESYYPGKASQNLKRNHFPTVAKYVDALTLMCGNIRLSDKGVQSFVSFVWYTNERKEKLENRGILESINDYVMLESDLEKEHFIYNTLYYMGNKKTGITLDTIEEVISDFEEDRGFKLNELQVEGCKLTMFHAAVLSGCAGSGKTTTSDCMSEILKTLGDKYKLIYCTPTGKACRRLAEVVHTTVRTLHSQFGIGISGESYIDANIGRRYRAGLTDEHCIYVLDEMAMASTPLLYEVVKNLGDNDLVYFLGDIKQLPAIGKGCPFAVLMKLLPCVELGVSKRAAEGSLINYNTTLINNMSDGIVRSLKYDGSTFIKIDCPDAELPLAIRKLWGDFMSGKIGGKKWNEDDIQVITGYQKEDIIFSSPNINPVIQNLLRAKDKLLFRHVSRLFYNNERVIHTKSNDYSMVRYIEVSPNIFEPICTFGVVNGEMGKLIGIVRSDMVRFHPIGDFSQNNPLLKDKSDEEIQELQEKYESRMDSLRNDEEYCSDKHYFVKMKVWDVDLQKDVILLYRARGKNQDGELILEGTDLGNLELAYALSTHKMQGSQSPVVIVPLGERCTPSFINRNMINTMITRSQEVVALLGSISGSDSALTKGRLQVSNFNCKDSLSILVNDKMFS